MEEIRNNFEFSGYFMQFFWVEWVFSKNIDLFKERLLQGKIFFKERISSKKGFVQNKNKSRKLPKKKKRRQKNVTISTIVSGKIPKNFVCA